MNDSDPQQARQVLGDFFSEKIPHSAALGMEVLETDRGRALTRLPYRREFLGDAENGLWHTSVGVSLIDASFGLVVLLALDDYESIATLDLRMDYLRPAVADRDLYARVECYQLTRSIAFVRGVLYQDEERPTAQGVASFMRTARKGAV